jgi:hypothetical protein
MTLEPLTITDLRAEAIANGWLLSADITGDDPRLWTADELDAWFDDPEFVEPTEDERDWWRTVRHWQLVARVDADVQRHAEWNAADEATRRRMDDEYVERIELLTRWQATEILRRRGARREDLT